MKRFLVLNLKTLLTFILVCCFVFPLCAHADTLQDRLGVPTHIADTFNSHTGKVVITLDADVSIPEADNVRTYRAVPRLFSAPETDAMANAVFGKRAYHDAGTGNYGSNVPIRVYESENTVYDRDRMYPEFSLTVYQSTLNNGSADWVEASFERRQVYGEPIYWMTSPEGMQLNITPKGCSLSFDEARQLADDAIHAFAPQFTCMVQGVMDGELSGKETKDGTLSYTNKQQAWILWYTRGDFGMPVTAEGTSPSRDYNRQHQNEQIIVIVIDEGIYGMNYQFPHDVTVLQDNCTLLPFNQIMDVVRKVMPLSLGWLESSYSDVRVHITDIRLGYMLVMSKDNPDCYEYIPVWDFFGTRECRKTKNGNIVSEQSSSLISHFTVNALDGTVIDRDYGY